MSVATYGALLCAVNGCHTFIRHGCASNAGDPTWGPAFCSVCGISQEFNMPIAVCGHCRQDTGGNHEPDCPLSPANRAALPTGWICPKCGASNAPKVERCACSPADAVVTKRLLLG